MPNTPKRQSSSKKRRPKKHNDMLTTQSSKVKIIQKLKDLTNKFKNDHKGVHICTNSAIPDYANPVDPYTDILKNKTTLHVDLNKLKTLTNNG